MNKKILIGSILATFLLLMMTCISAVNVQTTEQVMKENFQEKIETIREKFEAKLVNNAENKLDLEKLKIRLMGLVTLITAVVGYGILLGIPKSIYAFIIGFIIGLFDDEIEMSPMESAIWFVKAYWQNVAWGIKTGIYMFINGEYPWPPT